MNNNKRGQNNLEIYPLSLLDRISYKLRTSYEKTYSAPLSIYQFNKETIIEAGLVKRDRPKLKYPRMHLFGTDRIGEDIFYCSLKSIRTAMVIGGLTTLIAIPFALLFGILAGYYGGIVDDIIQYIYSTIASIPDVLLIVAFMLLSGKGLFQLSFILGITGWVGLCRLVRGETMKLKELDFVSAAKSMGVSDFKIMTKHIVLNLTHIVIIVFVLRFSGLVLAEAVLSYIGIGVGTETYSWGNMINIARQELTREPMVWWPLSAAFIFMFILVISVNVLGDRLRDAIDPRFKLK